MTLPVPSSSVAICAAACHSGCVARVCGAYVFEMMKKFSYFSSCFICHLACFLQNASLSHPIREKTQCCLSYVFHTFILLLLICYIFQRFAWTSCKVSWFNIMYVILSKRHIDSYLCLRTTVSHTTSQNALTSDICMTGITSTYQMSTQRNRPTDINKPLQAVEQTVIRMGANKDLWWTEDILSESLGLSAFTPAEAG